MSHSFHRRCNCKPVLHNTHVYSCCTVLVSLPYTSDTSHQSDVPLLLCIYQLNLCHTKHFPIADEVWFRFSFPTMQYMLLLRVHWIWFYCLLFYFLGRSRLLGWGKDVTGVCWPKSVMSRVNNKHILTWSVNFNTFSRKHGCWNYYGNRFKFGIGN